MKKYLEMILQKTNEFINYKKTDKEEDDNSHILQTIDLALRKNSGVHVIFLDKNFTGDIVKYDRDRQQLIVKNFKKSMTTIIRVPDIQRISLVPNNIREAQKKRYSARKSQIKKITLQIKSDLKSFLSLKVNGRIYRIISSAINSHQRR